MLNKYIKPVEFQIILDDGEERCLPALLNINTGAVMVPREEKKEGERRDSISIVIKNSRLTVVLDVCDTNGDYTISQSNLLRARAALLPTDIPYWSSNYIEDIALDKVELEVYECSCGYHATFDASYLEQVDLNASQKCPSCDRIIFARTVTDSDAMQSYAKIAEGVYHFAQGWKHPQPGTDEIDYAEEVIDIKKYTDEQIKDVLFAFGYTLDQIKEDNPNSWQAILAECIFERNQQP